MSDENLAAAMLQISATMNDIWQTLLGREDCLRDKFAIVALPFAMDQLKGTYPLRNVAGAWGVSDEVLCRYASFSRERAAALMAYAIADAMLWARGQVAQKGKIDE